METDYVTIEETYNKQGVCTSRLINEEEIGGDREPSIEILKNVAWVKTHKYMTPMEVKNAYGIDIEDYPLNN
jgi:hypothetical protein